MLDAQHGASAPAAAAPAAARFRNVRGGTSPNKRHRRTRPQSRDKNGGDNGDFSAAPSTSAAPGPDDLRPDSFRLTIVCASAPTLADERRLLVQLETVRAAAADSDADSDGDDAGAGDGGKTTAAAALPDFAIDIARATRRCAACPTAAC